MRPPHSNQLQILGGAIVLGLLLAVWWLAKTASAPELSPAQLAAENRKQTHQTSTRQEPPDKAHTYRPHATAAGVYPANAPTTPRIALKLPDDQAYQYLLRQLAQEQVTPLQRLPKLHAVVIPNDYHLLARLRRNIPQLTWENDAQVRKPDTPKLTATTPGVPFQNGLLPWLGINPRQQGRGKDVTIAILDQPIARTHSTENARLMQVDTFKLAATQNDGHGNAIASLMVANSEHLKGIAPEADIISIPVLGPQGEGSVFTLAQAIVQATDMGAHIISLSLGTNANSDILQQAVDYAHQRGTVIVAAAGNDAQPTPVYPAACPNVIGVSACDASKNLTTFSNYGDHVDIAAPGLAIQADFGTHEQTELFSGTSAATPCVAAVIATILGDNQELTPQEAAKIVLQYAVDNGAPRRDPQFGEGILSYAQAATWKNPDFTDAMAAGQFLDLEHATDTVTPLIASAQNTGNTTIQTMTVNLQVNGHEDQKTFHHVQPGETVSLTLDVPNDQRNRISVKTTVFTDADEASVDNNTKQSKISVVKR